MDRSLRTMRSGRRRSDVNRYRDCRHLTSIAGPLVEESRGTATFHSESGPDRYSLVVSFLWLEESQSQASDVLPKSRIGLIGSSNIPISECGKPDYKAKLSRGLAGYNQLLATKTQW